MSTPQGWTRRREGEIPESFRQRFGPLLAQLLWSRGYGEDNEADIFLNPKLESLKSPFSLLNLLESSGRVASAIEANEQIAVYADYDMDGMSGLALLVSFFSACGSQNVIPYQPDRFLDGYGVHPQAIKNLAEKGVRVIVTVDTGIGAFEAAEEARRHGVDLIITDHHQQIGSKVPATPYVINPNQAQDGSGLGYLSGAGVAFYLSIGVRAKLRERGFFKNGTGPDLRSFLDFFVLGTIADHVGLVGDNRILVRAGLKQLLETKRPGLKMLVDRILPNAKNLSTRDVGFSITPKLNAASRLGKAHLSTELLLTQDLGRAKELVDEIVELNERRGQIQSQVFEEAFVQAAGQIEESDPPIIVVHGAWHEGVLGVVAAKLVEKFIRPSIVLTKVGEQDLLRGSMRTLSHVSCVKALDACKEFLHRYGGHSMAAGLQLKPSLVKDFSERLWTSTNNFLETLTSQQSVSFDGELPLEIDCAAVEELQAAAPWGVGNPEPLFCLKEIDFADIQMLKGQHLKCQISNGATVIGFFKSDDVARLKKLGAKRFDALVTPEINRFRNQKTLQLRLHYVRPSEASDFNPGP